MQQCQGIVLSMHCVQVKELLLPFGSLKAFNLVMDKNTGNSKVDPQGLMSFAISGSQALVSPEVESYKSEWSLCRAAAEMLLCTTAILRRTTCPCELQKLIEFCQNGCSETLKCNPVSCIGVPFPSHGLQSC